MTTWNGPPEPPAGGGTPAASTPPAGSSGAEFRALWKAARTERGKDGRRRAGRHARGTVPPRAGMHRKPPAPKGDDAA